MRVSGVFHPPSLDSDSVRDPYRGVVLVLLSATLVGTVGAAAGARALANPVLLDVAVSLGIWTAILIGLSLTQAARARPQIGNDGRSGSVQAGQAEAGGPTTVSPIGVVSTVRAHLTEIPVRIWHRFRDLRKRKARQIWVSVAAAGVMVIGLVLQFHLPASLPTAFAAGIAAAVCLGAAGFAATAVRYLAGIEPSGFPESPGLSRGARVVAWILVLAATSMALAWAGQQTALRLLHMVVLAINAAVCYGLFAIEQPEDETAEIFPLDFGVLSLLGNRPNILVSVLDAGERQLGIDLRSTWALTVVRGGLEPLIIGLCLTGWLSTSLTIVGVSEQGLVERLGVPQRGQPLFPGLHLHWPWPVDRVFRISVQRVQTLNVGREFEPEEGRGPENVLWAVQHAPNEYTLLLGNGRELVTVDASVQFRIVDARAWRYDCQNPVDALKVIAYRAVMRTTVNRTLADVLSENIVTSTARLRTMVQQDANALGLGVEILGFTVGGMHPPVPVAAAYEAVVSAELGKVTAVVSAQAYRNQTVPFAESSALMGESGARAEGAGALARASGEAWSFLALESEYRSAPEEYFFRRRLEALEKGLLGRRFTVVDARVQRDGGELWVIP